MKPFPCNPRSPSNRKGKQLTGASRLVFAVLAIRGAREILVMFFCYCALESTAMLWASSYMALGKGIDKTTAAMWGSLFCIGITVGRLASGFLTMKLNDPAMIRLGQALVLTGIVIMLLPLPHNIGTIAD